MVGEVEERSGGVIWEGRADEKKVRGEERGNRSWWGVRRLAGREVCGGVDTMIDNQEQGKAGPRFNAVTNLFGFWMDANLY